LSEGDRVSKEETLKGQLQSSAEAAAKMQINLLAVTVIESVIVK